MLNLKYNQYSTVNLRRFPVKYVSLNSSLSSQLVQATLQCAVELTSSFKKFEHKHDISFKFAYLKSSNVKVHVSVFKQPYTCKTCLYKTVYNHSHSELVANMSHFLFCNSQEIHLVQDNYGI